MKDLSDEELIAFHSIDRDLYAFLVLALFRDPIECLEILAFWIWLERTNLTEIVKKQLSLPYVLVNELADEALLCLKCIKNVHFLSEGCEVPLIQTLTDTEISLRDLYRNRLIIIPELECIKIRVCARAFRDITQAGIERKLAHAQEAASPSYSNGQRGGPNAQDSVEKTMFLTFSRGYPVQEWELREFFTMAFGDCIESLHVQEVQSGEQSLFARIVFRSLATIGMILNGNEKAKFIVNGKHVWARRYEPRRQRSSSSSSSSVASSSQQQR